MWSTGFLSAGRRSTDLPSTRTNKWSTGSAAARDTLRISEIDHFTTIKPQPNPTQPPSLSWEEKTGQAWPASNYGKSCPRGWDTGNRPTISLEPPTDAHEPHLAHHNNLHKISMRRQRNQHQHRPLLKIHRYPWNAEPLVVGGVDCGEPKTLHLSARMSTWRKRSERQLKINKQAGTRRSFSDTSVSSSKGYGTRSNSRSHVQLDPSKHRRKREAVVQANHDQTLMGSYARMQQYTSTTSKLAAARESPAPKTKPTTRTTKLPSTLPRSMQGSIATHNSHFNATHRSTRLQRRSSRGSNHNDDDNNDNANNADANNANANVRQESDEASRESIDFQARTEELKNQLTEVIVDESLYKLIDLRTLFDETIRNAMRSSDDPMIALQAQEAAQLAVAFVCNELDIPAVGRLALEQPELLVPHSSTSEGTRRTGRSPRATTSEPGDEMFIKIHHWSDHDVFRT